MDNPPSRSSLVRDTSNGNDDSLGHTGSTPARIKPRRAANGPRQHGSLQEQILDLDIANVSTDCFLDLVNHTSPNRQIWQVESSQDVSNRQSEQSLAMLDISGPLPELNTDPAFENSLSTFSTHQPVSSEDNNPLQGSDPSPSGIFVSSSDMNTARNYCCDSRRASIPNWIAAWCPCGKSSHTTVSVSEAHALSVPPLATIELLLGYYFSYSYWASPIASEWEIWALLHPQEVTWAEEQRPMSLAYLNALLFAGSAHATEEESKAASFASVRKMRDTFYQRAKRKYPDAMFENEYWILKAHDILQQAIFSPDSASPCQQQRIGAQWKRLRAIFSTRIGYIRLGNRSNGVPKLQDVVPRLSVEDLEEDLRFSWFVSCELKQKLIQVLLASCELTADSEPLCRLLTWRSALAQTVTVSSGYSNHPLMGDAERIEQLLGDWKSRHQRLLMADAVDDISTNPLKFPLFVSQAMLRLLFE
ncbi:hypothetical protein FOPE_00489 [Fonsecaea pedrosoi]|nr:hypothetical protein FOPE_00489 [Fonsecaea pedrosoi]